MPPVEIRCDVGELADVIRAAEAKTIAIDGCTYVGKTTRARCLARLFKGVIIDIDDYLGKFHDSYVETVKHNELRLVIENKKIMMEC